jgi:hypothetical protein
MKRLLLSAAVVLPLLAAAIFSHGFSAKPEESPQTTGLKIQAEQRNPWNHLKLNNDSATFRFAIVTDRTGGPRPGVFERAVEQLNWLQPEFVVCVGDLIQGKTEEVDRIEKQWKEFHGFIAKLEMPFFYLPGNHDINNKVMDKVWQEQLGRRFYHFIYKDVLFLMLNSEDPPSQVARFSKEQIAYARKVLAENAKVRWTIVLMHKPVWTYPSMDRSGWLEIEDALAGRRYTVFAGHRHKYQKFERKGQAYYMLATTGGASGLRGPRFGEFDHIVWVTFKSQGPVLANLMMEGIFPDNIGLEKAEKR